MKLSGSYTFAAPRPAVWDLLNDPASLKRIIPGCERLEEIEPDLYAADIKIGLAGVRGDYTGTVRLSEQQPPERYRLEGDGRGKPGFAKGSGIVELLEADEGTTSMRYTADVQVGGPVASVGQRLIEGAAKSIINQSLKALSAELAARQTAAPPTPAPEPTPEQSVAGDPTQHPAMSNSQTPAAPSTPAPAPPPARAEPAASSSGLTSTDVIRGMASDFIAERPAVRYALPLLGGFLLGLLVGTRLGRGR